MKGFSHGFNCSEAVNIANIEWLKFYRNAVKDHAKNGFLKKISFPVEWLLIQLILNIESTTFSNEVLTKVINMKLINNFFS